MFFGHKKSIREQAGGPESERLKLEDYLENRVQTQKNKNQKDRTALLEAILEKNIPSAERSFKLAIQKGEIGTIRQGLLALKRNPIQISISNFIILAIELNQEKIVELLSLFYLSQPVTEPQKGLKQRIFYYSIKCSIASLVKVLLTPTHFPEINLKKEEIDDIPEGATALYYAVEARQTALATRQFILTSTQKNPTDKNLETPEILRLKFTNNACNAKTILNSDLIVLLLLNAGADFGNQSSYTTSSQVTIEEARGTYITLLYQKAVEASLTELSSKIVSIISGYAGPYYVSHSEDPNYQPTKKSGVA